MRLRFLSLLGLAGLTLSRASDSWPQFRGPAGQGCADAAAPPITWSETEHVKWKTRIPGEGWSSPVILDGQIWLTTALEDGESLRAVCVDQEGGSILRDVEVFHVERPGRKHALNSYASPTPVIEKGRVYVCFGASGTACLSTTDATILWRNQELQLDHENGPGSSPALARDKLIVPCDGTNIQYLAALNTLTGQLAWKTARSGPSLPTIHPERRKAYSTPLVISVRGTDQVVVPGAEYVYAYDPASGAEIWRVHYPGFSNVPRPLFAHGLLYIGTGFPKPELWAIRPDGQGDVTQSHVAWKCARQAPAKPSPLVVGGHVYMVNDSGFFTCLDALTGAEIWQERLGGDYSASPVFASGRIYCFSHQGLTTVLEAGRTFKVLARNQLQDGFMASPAIIGNALYLRTKTSLYRIQ